MTERIVVDRLTGLALSGIDPVAYFTDRAPHAGKAAYEYAYKGAVWRFENQGNRAAFIRDPDVYAPQFGGYDPVALARDVAVPGHSLIWLISDNRLYLFSDAQDRTAFLSDPEQWLRTAERGWQAVEPKLVK